MSGVAFGLFSVLVSIMFVELSVPWFYIWSLLGMSLRIAFEKDRESRVESEELPASESLPLDRNRLVNY